jgi:hypothetical protein
MVDAMGGQHAADRAGRDQTAESRQFPLDPLVAPSRVVGGKTQDDGLDVGGQRWSTWAGRSSAGAPSGGARRPTCPA